MAQLSLYLTDATMMRLRADAEQAGSSLSKYVSGLVEHPSAQAGWPEGYWTSVYGALADPSFVVPAELDPSLDGVLPSFSSERAEA